LLPVAFFFIGPLLAYISFPPTPFPFALFLNVDAIDGHYTNPLSPSGPKAV
jgi:hypothetical protein